MTAIVIAGLDPAIHHLENKVPNKMDARVIGKKTVLRT
jgi:hypothetical protein